MSSEVRGDGADRRDRWGAIAVGTPAPDFEPRPAVAASYRPDTVADGWSTDEVTVRLASVRGYAHRYGALPRQDDAAVIHHPGTNTVVFAVADGVSAAPLAHIGSTAACRAAVTAALTALDAGAAVDWQRVVEHAAWQVVEQAGSMLDLDRPDPERAESAMATTLITGLVRFGALGLAVTLVRVGDGGAWALRDGRYRALFDPAEPDRAVVGSAVIALPRVPEVAALVDTLGPDDVLLIGTDGFGDPLGDGSGQVGAHFANCLAAPRPPLDFARDLDFSRETFDDDRTLLAIWPRP